MHTTDERLVSIKGRVKEIKREKRRKQAAGLTALALACPVLLLAVILTIPAAMQSAGAAISYSGMAASLFSDDPVPAYVVVGVIAFALGITFTVLCYKLKELKSGKAGEESL